jgi:hypothetical protein
MDYDPNYGDFNVMHPLDWWARGGLAEVCVQYGKLEPQREWRYPTSKRRAYKRVHGALNQMYKQTGDPLWKPYGNQAHERLRKRIREFRVWNYDLV